MKLFLLLALSIFASCESEDPKKLDNTGGTIEFLEADLPSDDAARLRSICSALSMKEDQLDILLSSEYTFNYAQKGCTEAKLGAAKNIKVTIERPYGNYVFMAENGDNFAFPDVETQSNGVLAKICQTSGRLKSPFITSSTGATWFTTSTNVKHCAPSNTQFCVHLQRGSLVQGRTYKIHTNEWIKFKLDNPRRGFFVERKLITTANCTSGNNIERQAVLK